MPPDPHELESVTAGRCCRSSRHVLAALRWVGHESRRPPPRSGPLVKRRAGETAVPARAEYYVLISVRFVPPGFAVAESQSDPRFRRVSLYRPRPIEPMAVLDVPVQRHSSHLVKRADTIRRCSPR